MFDTSIKLDHGIIVLIVRVEFYVDNLLFIKIAIFCLEMYRMIEFT